MSTSREVTPRSMLLMPTVRMMISRAMKKMSISLMMERTRKRREILLKKSKNHKSLKSG